MAGGNKGVAIWDIRMFSEYRRIGEMHADDHDVLSVRLKDTLLTTACEDSLVGICDIESTVEDDYVLLNIQEPVLKSGFSGENVWCLTVNKYCEYDVCLSDENTPPSLLRKLTLPEIQGMNTSTDYFIGNLSSELLATGSHS